MKLALYYAPITCSLVPYVTLTEAGAGFEVRPLNFRKSENRAPDYLKLNPAHKVPVLMIDGQVLTENVAIQIWIARNFPAAQFKLDLSGLGNCAAHFERMKERPSVQKLLAYEAAVLNEFAKVA